MFPLAMPAQLKHETVKVRDIVKDFRCGRWVVPEFQRDDVWGRSKSKASKLIESLYRRYPISSMLIWQTQDHVRARHHEPRQASNTPVSWIIDGQQRVRTLNKAWLGDEGIDVAFNVETEDFSQSNAATTKDRRWVRVAEMWEDDQFFSYRRNLPEDGKGRLIEQRLERLRRILDYD